MNQYIITEEELSYLANTGSCYDEEIEEKVRSHPYNPQVECEKVLREMQELVAQYCGDGIHKGWFLAYPIDRWIAAELRKGGE